MVGLRRGWVLGWWGLGVVEVKGVVGSRGWWSLSSGGDEGWWDQGVGVQGGRV